MDPFTLLIKPTSADCNLRCDYCFYLEKENLYPGKKSVENWAMPEPVLESFVRQMLEGSTLPAEHFAWQGGEPTIMGLDFYRKAVELAEKYRRPGMSFLHTMQTNGTLIDDEWAAVEIFHIASGDRISSFYSV